MTYGLYPISLVMVVDRGNSYIHGGRCRNQTRTNKEQVAVSGDGLVSLHRVLLLPTLSAISQHEL